MPMIAIEGLDGAGKGTQMRMLVERLMIVGAAVRFASFPRYGTPLGAVILRFLKGEDHLANGSELASAMVLQSMMFADRYDAAVMIREFLGRRDGTVGDERAFVVCDRWTASAEAYGAAAGLDPAWLARCQELLPKADLTIFLDVSEEERRRRKPIPADKNESNAALQRGARDRYLTFLEARRSGWARVDGFGTADEVHERVYQVVCERLP